VCVAGVPACRAEQPPHWLGPELWVIELSGEATEWPYKLVAPAGRPVNRVRGWPFAMCAYVAATAFANHSTGEIVQDLFSHGWVQERARQGRWLAGAQREHRCEREPVVHARFEIQRVAHDAWHAWVRHDPGKEHRIGRRQQRPE
jgi:hypothetical protein